MEVYLDNSATTKPYEEVIEAVSNTMRELYGNPSSIHTLGLKAEQKLNECRERIASTIHGSREEIFFTSGGSESNNFLIRAFVKEGGHIITTNIEHPSVMNICKELEKKGISITYLDVDTNGKVCMDQLSESINKNTQLVSIMHVNNEIGVIQDIEAIGNLIKGRSNRAKFHVDAVQSYGKLKIDVQKSKIDLLSASAHKIHGPRGVGLAYIKKGLVAKPLIYGGGQEKGFRSGTENLAGIAGFAEASAKIQQWQEQNFDDLTALKSYFIDKLKEIENTKINSTLERDSIPHIVSASFSRIRAEVLLHLLEERGIYVSTGSACSSKDTKDSYVLQAIGLKGEDIKGTLRFSFSEYTTKEELEYTIEALKAALKFLRRAGK